jgi:hypothetical protein
MMFGPNFEVYAGKTYDSSHGSPFDRGSADSYYGRARMPHRGGVGGDSGPRIEMSLLSPEEINAYHAGYDWNEQFGGRKEY